MSCAGLYGLNDTAAQAAALGFDFFDTGFGHGWMDGKSFQERNDRAGFRVSCRGAKQAEKFFDQNSRAQEAGGELITRGSKRNPAVRRFEMGESSVLAV